MENLKIKYIPLGPFGPGKPGVPLPPPGGPVRIEKKIIHIFVTTSEFVAKTTFETAKTFIRRFRK